MGRARVLMKAAIPRRHGEAWREFRSRVQRPCLQPKTVRSYIAPIEDVTDCFLKR